MRRRTDTTGLGRRVRRGLALALLLVPLGVPSSAAAPSAAADVALPVLTGPEFKALYYALQPIPSTVPITSPPAIYGHAAADARIRQLATRRGYRLQSVPSGSLQGVDGQLLSPTAAAAFRRLQAAARAHGTPLQINSGYRSIAQQREIFRRRLGGWSTAQIASGQADGAIEAVLAYHSIPGYSKHHTGVTMDLSHAGGSNGSFRGSAAYRWISADNFHEAKQLGFIPSYPDGAGAQGPNPEPWEFVYVGVPAIRCAARVITVADPRARSLCGGGTSTPAVIRLVDGQLRWLLRNSNSGGPATIQLTYGRVGDVPIVGDWDGNGTETIGIRRGTTFHLRNTNTSGPAQISFSYGLTTDLPIAGDWDGNGRDTIGIRRGTTFHLRNTNTSGPAQTSYSYGLTTDWPLIGDWDGNGTETIGIRRGTTFHLRNTNTSGPAQTSFSYGLTTDWPLAGDWDGNGRDTVGIRRGTTFHLRNTNTSGPAQISYSYGLTADYPIVGDWDDR